MSPRKKRRSTLPTKLRDTPPVSNRRSNQKARRKRTSDAPRLTSEKKPKSKGSEGVQEDAQFVVGLDFGTTYSGFSYASMDDPDKVFTYENWPSKGEAGAFKYSKTQTSLRYLRGETKGTFELQDWGWPAYVKHCDELQERNSNMTVTTNSPNIEKRSSLFFKNFKLHLADGSISNYTYKCKQEQPPEGLSAQQFIADYLRELSTFAMADLKTRFGSFIQKKDVKWCLTVPTIWTDSSKHTMRLCSEMAGLVQGPHCRDEDASMEENFSIVLEPEAASVYSLQKLKDSHDLKRGSKVLVVDAGGGTVDLVVHELVDDSGLRVKEVTSSTGDVCGSTFLDLAFKKFLARKIGCLQKFYVEQPVTMLDIYGKWEGLKYSFDRGQQRHVLALPAKLATAWENYQDENGLWSEEAQYDHVVITRDDMKSIFDGPVNTILNLIKGQLALVPEVEAIFVVGGFSNSPYLMERIRAKFLCSVKNITCPIDPGSAVSQGAAIIGTLGVDIMMSRKSRKTYGVSMFRPFRKGDPPGSNVNADNGEALCKDAFDVFTRIGDDVPVNHCVRRRYGPFSKSHSTIVFTVYCTTVPNPTFVTDRGVQKVGTWTYRLPLEAQKTKKDPLVEVAMYFGRTHIEMSAEPANFVGGQKSKFSVSFDRELR